MLMLPFLGILALNVARVGWKTTLLGLACFVVVLACGLLGVLLLARNDEENKVDMAVAAERARCVALVNPIMAPNSEVGYVPDLLRRQIIAAIERDTEGGYSTLP